MFGLSSSKKDSVFYDAFEEHARCVVRAAELFVQALRSPERVIEISKQVSSVEAEGDTITHDTIARLHKTWITPFDRADIHVLISTLDDVLDLTEEAANRLALYEIRTAPDFVIGLASVLLQATQATEKAVRLLPKVKQPGEMLKLCVEINRLKMTRIPNTDEALPPYSRANSMPWPSSNGETSSTASRQRPIVVKTSPIFSKVLHLSIHDGSIGSHNRAGARFRLHKRVP